MMLGAQTYTVRTYTQNERDFRETMKRIAAIGYECVQLSAIGNNVNQIAYWANAQQSASEADIQEAAALVRRAWRLVKETL